jgi:hypothetical protein
MGNLALLIMAWKFGSPRIEMKLRASVNCIDHSINRFVHTGTTNAMGELDVMNRSTTKETNCSRQA